MVISSLSMTFISAVCMSYFNRFCVSYLQFADNEELQSEWREAKRRNKIKVASFLKEKTGYFVDPDAMFDVQVIP